MRKIPLAAIALALLAPLPSHADTSKTYDFTGFDQLDIAAGVDVIFETGPAWSVRIEFEEGDPDDMKLRQDDGRLYISPKMTSSWKNRVDATAYVTAPALNEIEASSGSSIRATGLDADILVLDASSGATIEADGVCGSLKIVANSGGTATARNVICEKVAANASSGGSVTAYASQSARTHTSSGGSVDIYGGPTDREANHPLTGGDTTFH